LNHGDVVPRFLHQDGGKLVPLATRAHPKDDRIEQTPCILALAPISFGGLTSLMIGSISSQRSPDTSHIVSSGISLGRSVRLLRLCNSHRITGVWNIHHCLEIVFQYSTPDK
jgi:hypothetical protein